MIKARATDKDGKPLIVIGLEAGNIERLKKGQPILFDMVQLGLEGHCLIVYGETPADVAIEIEKTGLRLGHGRGS